MDATHFFSLTNQSTSLAGDASPVVPAVKVEDRSTEFSEFFKNQIQLQMRQDIAAPTQDLVELQMVPLGSNLNLITTNTPIPDIASLANFARAQGLDEEAVKTLFGAGLVEQVKSAPLELTSSFDTKKLLSGLDPFSLAGLGASASAVFQNTPIQALEALPAPTVQSAQIQLSTNFYDETVSPQTDIRGSFLQTSKALTELTSTVELTSATRQKMDTLMPAENLSAAPSTIRLPINTTITTLMPTLANTKFASEAEVIRVRIEAPSEAITQKLSEISGTKVPLSWSALLASAAIQSTTNAEVLTRSEILPVDIPTALLADLTEDSNAEGVGVDQLQVGAPPIDLSKIHVLANEPGSGTQNSSSDHRQEQYQLLAERLGEAVAQKLIRQIERGEWKLQLRLQPSNLGRIDIALEMHSGELDALFTAENGVTRDLIAQGASKLKDALAQSGMEVASVFVNSDQGQKSDGKPTSGRPGKGGTDPEQSKQDVSLAVVNVSAGSPISSVADGLDVLA